MTIPEQRRVIPMGVEARTIGEVIRRLDEIVEWAREHGSRLGYFAALYRKVTRKVQERIDGGFFEDGERMERLDVLFANRYLEAFRLNRSDGLPTRSWRVAFAAARRWWPIVLQHLLLGMNAHINLDLGIAAARTSPAAAIHDLRNDFIQINGILAGLIDEVQAALTRIWPMLGLLDRIAGRTEEAVLNFSIGIARDHAWNLAWELAPLDEPNQASRIAEVDAAVAALGQRIHHPGFYAGTVTKAIRLGERGAISQIIDILR